MNQIANQFPRMWFMVDHKVPGCSKASKTQKCKKHDQETLDNALISRLPMAANGAENRVFGIMIFFIPSQGSLDLVAQFVVMIAKENDTLSNSVS